MRCSAIKVFVITSSFFLFSSQFLLETFEDWKTKHNISFGNATIEAAKKTIFEEFKTKVIEHNKNALATYTLELNKFAAISTQDFIAQRCGAKRTKATTSFNIFSLLTMLRSRLFKRTANSESSSGKILGTSAPPTLDLRSYTLGVLDQGSCGSCWAFATASMLESKLLMKDSKYNTPLSPQYFMDCDLRDFACNG
jgi:C1A family cysteine protease